MPTCSKCGSTRTKETREKTSLKTADYNFNCSYYTHSCLACGIKDTQSQSKYFLRRIAEDLKKSGQLDLALSFGLSAAGLTPEKFSQNSRSNLFWIKLQLSTAIQIPFIPESAWQHLLAAIHTYTREESQNWYFIYYSPLKRPS